MSRQGSEHDVNSYFYISSIFNPCDITYEELENLVANDGYAYKVISYYPERMARIEFSVNTKSSHTKSEETSKRLSWISNQLIKIPKAFEIAQEEANVYGESYLRFDIFPVVSNNKNKGGLVFDPKTWNAKTHIQLPRSGMILSRELAREIKDKVDNEFFTIPNNPNNADSTTLIINIDEKLTTNQSTPLTGTEWDSLETLDVGFYRLLNYEDGWDRFKEKNINSYGLNVSIFDKHIIPGHRVLTFKAFGYRPIKKLGNVISDTEQKYYSPSVRGYDSIGNRGSSNVERYRGYPVRHSYRLIRFLQELKIYRSFKSITHNRVVRNEFIAHGVDGLGLALADSNRLQGGYAGAGGDAFSNLNSGYEDYTRALMQDNENMAKSATYNSVIKYDKNDDLKILSRDHNGVEKLDNIFRRDVLAESGLTEFALFHTTEQGSGLAAIDSRTKEQEKNQVLSLYTKHWESNIDQLIDSLAEFVNWTEDSDGELYISHVYPLSKSDSEIQQETESNVNSRLNILKEGVIAREELRYELSSPDTELGRSYKLQLDGMNSDDDSNKIHPVFGSAKEVIEGIVLLVNNNLMTHEQANIALSGIYPVLSSQLLNDPIVSEELKELDDDEIEIIPTISEDEPNTLEIDDIIDPIDGSSISDTKSTSNIDSSNPNDNILSNN